MSCLLGCNLILSILCEQLILLLWRCKIPTLYSLVWTGCKARIFSMFTILVLIVAEQPLAIREQETASTLRGTLVSEAVHCSSASMTESQSGKTCGQCFLLPRKSLAELAGSWHNLDQPSICSNLWLWLIHSQPRNGKLLQYMCCELLSLSNHRSVPQVSWNVFVPWSGEHKS